MSKQGDPADPATFNGAVIDASAFRMASGPDWLALLGPDEDYVPIEPWGRIRENDFIAC